MANTIITKKIKRLAALKRQTSRLQQQIGRLEKISSNYSWLRLILFLVGAGLTLTAFYFFQGWAGWPVLLLSAVVFGVVAFLHNKVETALTKRRIWLSLKKTQIARIELDWSAIPPATTPLATGEHPFEIDLDMTGERSLHRMLDTAISQEGSLRLRKWLLDNAPNAATIAYRQKLVAELSRLNRFRGRLQLVAAMASREANQQFEGQKLLKWLDIPLNAPAVRQTFLALAGLSLGTIALAILRRLGVVGDFWILTFILYLIIFWGRGWLIKNLYSDAWTLKDGLNRLEAVLKYIENYNYRPTPELHKLCQSFLDPQNKPSRQLRRATQIVSGASLQKNAILWFLTNLIIPWDYFFADRLNSTRSSLKKFLPTWLDTWFELESLSSLAEFAYLNPEYTFPEINPAANAAQPVLQSSQLGHPLIPFEQKVPNDFTLEKLGQALIITGSNMAGKSSFLRTLGANLRLAYAGGVVNAVSLQVGLFRVFTCIKVSDSVTDGFSYFYAEVRRLKALLNELEKTEELPLFFLIDEIFRGTNNRERLIGSRAYVRALVGGNGTGAISTHDLELVKLADENPMILNYHFREEVVDGLMTFDYRLHSGPCPTTNALKIMELSGLPVEG